MTYFAIIKLYDESGHNKDFEIECRADKAIAKAINFLKAKDGDNVMVNILFLLKKDFDDLGKKMFGDY